MSSRVIVEEVERSLSLIFVSDQNRGQEIVIVFVDLARVTWWIGLIKGAWKTCGRA